MEDRPMWRHRDGSLTADERRAFGEIERLLRNEGPEFRPVSRYRAWIRRHEQQLLATLGLSLSLLGVIYMSAGLGFGVVAISFVGFVMTLIGVTLLTKHPRAERLGARLLAVCRRRTTVSDDIRRGSV
jgi:hypothetical protein